MLSSAYLKSRHSKPLQFLHIFHIDFLRGSVRVENINERKLTMKRVLLSLLVVIVILAALGAAGFAGYQYGYRQGALASSNGNTQVAPSGRDFGPNRMPMHNFGFDHGFGDGFGMMRRGIGFGFLSPLFFLLRIAFWVLVIWAIYMLISRSGWRLTRETTSTTTVNPPAPTETYTKEETNETKTK
jgi:uncharacterized membrane protein